MMIFESLPSRQRRRAVIGAFFVSTERHLKMVIFESLPSRQIKARSIERVFYAPPSARTKRVGKGVLFVFAKCLTPLLFHNRASDLLGICTSNCSEKTLTWSRLQVLHCSSR
jgi:hypothetical protein